MKYLALITIIVCSLCGCRSEDVPSPRTRTALISRSADHVAYAMETPKTTIPPHYPWETEQIAGIPIITKHFFRCKGRSIHPPVFLPREIDKPERMNDCNGGCRHSLPVVDGEEMVYPILLDLLNYIQKSTQSRVFVTCGHRCPQHNRYADPSKYNQTSKHQVGAEVDFYVEGYEESPQQIVDLIFSYYQNDPQLREFQRYTKPDTNVRTQPWYNKEVFVKLFAADEGRDFDNNHPYPYISIQVRYDKAADRRVTYTWHQAQNGYYRW